MAIARMRDGAQLHYIDVGRGAPVVMLHGFAMHGALWLPFALRHAHRYRFILPDLRGFGGSHHLSLSKADVLDQHADDLHDLVETLGLSRFVLGGLSMGACTALQYHRRYGFDRVSDYLNIDQSLRIRNTDDWKGGLMGATQDERLGPWMENMAQLAPWRGRAFRAIPRQLRQRFWAILSEFYGCAFHRTTWKRAAGMARQERVTRLMAPTANWPIYLDCLNAFMTENYDWLDSAASINVPVTNFVGMQSLMYPAHAQLQTAQRITQTHTVTFDECGHAIPFDAPLRFSRAFADFLASTRTTAATTARAA